MKMILKISIILNLSLSAGLLLILICKPGKPEPAPLIITDRSQKNEIVQAAAVVSRADGDKSFHWSELESIDYRIYVKNLRRIGCPEPTLRAIVTADVDAIYTEKNRDLEAKLTQLENNNDWSAQIKSFDAQQALKIELQKLPEEEAGEIADLLGLKPVPAPAAEDVASGPSTAHSRHNPPDAPVVMPLVFQDVDLSTLNLNSDQMQAVEDLRQSFLEQIGGANQDPDNPAYRERWQKAQPEIDSTLRGLIGGTAFENYQLAASEHTQ